MKKPIPTDFKRRQTRGAVIEMMYAGSHIAASDGSDADYLKIPQRIEPQIVLSITELLIDLQCLLYQSTGNRFTVREIMVKANETFHTLELPSDDIH